MGSGGANVIKRSQSTKYEQNKPKRPCRNCAMGKKGMKLSLSREERDVTELRSALAGIGDNLKNCHERRFKLIWSGLADKVIEHDPHAENDMFGTFIGTVEFFSKGVKPFSASAPTIAVTQNATQIFLLVPF